MKLPNSSLYLFASIVLLLCNCSQKEITRQHTHSKTTQFSDFQKLYTTAKSRKKDHNKRINAIDSFIEKATNLKSDSLLYKGYMLKTSILSSDKQHDKAIKYSQELLTLAEKNKDSIYIGKAYYKIGLYNKRLHNYLQAFENYNVSFKIHRNIGDSISAGKRLQAMANIQKTIGDYNGSKITATEGVKYLQNTKEYYTLVGLYHTISMCFRELKDYEEAHLWNVKAITLGNSQKISKKIMLKFQITKANIYSNQKKYSESTKLLTSLLQNPIVQKDSLEYARILSNLSYYKWQQNAATNSKEMLLKALEIRESKNAISGLIASNIHLANFFSKTDPQKALSHANAAKNNAIQLKNYQAILETLTIITALTPNDLEAFQEFQKASIAVNKLKNKARQIYAPTRFENEKLTQEKIVKEQKIKAQKATIAVIIIIFVIISLFIIIVFWRRHLIQKQQNTIEKIQSVYDTEIRLSKKIHDELANDLYQVMLQVESEIDKHSILYKLDHIYQEARNISRENSSIDIIENFDVELKEMVRFYSSKTCNVLSYGISEIPWENISKIKKLVLYRVLQELLVNMKKHSNARLTTIVFRQEQKQVVVDYEDNGIGCNLHTTTQKNGLTNAENRIETIGGTIKFDSKLNNGFEILIKFPLL